MEDEISEIYFKKQITLRTLSSVMTAQVDDGDLDLTSIIKLHVVLRTSFNTCDV